MSYLEERRALKMGLSSPAKNDKDALTEWYNDQIRASLIFGRCENCGDKLPISMAINPRTVIAHIVDKSEKNGVPEVETHPDNRFFACAACHDFYDKASSDEIKIMPVYAKLRGRLRVFWNLIPETKRRRVPDSLRPEYNG